MDLDGLALDQHGLEGLDAEAVQRWCTVQHHRVFPNDVLEHVVDGGPAALNHALGRLDVLGQLTVDQRLHHEGLEQLEGHQLGQAALVQLQRGTNHDDRAAGVVDALAQQVLAEPALLALQHVRQRLQRAVARPGDGTATAAVVEQCVDGLLQHALFVVDDDLGCAQVQQSLQAVVAVDHAAVQVVQVGGGKAATVQLHHRAQFRRDHRHHVEDHGPRVVLAGALFGGAVEGGNDLEALDRLLLALGRQWLLALGRVDLRPQLDLFLHQVDLLDQQLDGLGAHAAGEVVAVAVLQLTPELFVLDDLTGVQALELVPHPLEEVELLLVTLADGGQVLLRSLLAVADFGVLCTTLFQLANLALELVVALGQLQLELLVDLVTLGQVVGLQALEVLVALVDVDRHHQVGGEVDHLLQLLGLELLFGLGARQQVGQPRAGAAEVPDVNRRGGQLDVPHALAPNLGAGHLNAAALADDAAEAHPLVLAAVALPVFGGTKDLLAEQAVLLWLERAVVDGLRLLDLAVGPHTDLFGGGESDAQLGKVVDVKHERRWLLYLGLSGLLVWRCVLERVSGCRRAQRVSRAWRGDACRPRPSHARGGTGRCPAPRRHGRTPRRAPASESRRLPRRGPRH